MRGWPSARSTGCSGSWSASPRSRSGCSRRPAPRSRQGRGNGRAMPGLHLAHMKRTPWIAVAATLLALVCAPAAIADSIAYVKDDNVWLSTPDGSRTYQVTSTGGYADVSQADDGTMIALTGVRLHKLARDGKVLADFDTPVSDTRPAPA